MVEVCKRIHARGKKQKSIKNRHITNNQKVTEEMMQEHVQSLVQAKPFDNFIPSHLPPRVWTQRSTLKYSQMPTCKQGPASSCNPNAPRLLPASPAFPQYTCHASREYADPVSPECIDPVSPECIDLASSEYADPVSPECIDRASSEYSDPGIPDYADPKTAKDLFMFEEHRRVLTELVPELNSDDDSRELVKKTINHIKGLEHRIQQLGTCPCSYSKESVDAN